MKDKPIVIPKDIADKCKEADQFEKFDKVFSDMAENMGQTVKEAEPKKRGRPPKAKD